MERTERLTGGYSGRMLWLLALTWAILQVARYAIPPLLPEIRADLSLSLAQGGIIITVMQGTYGLFQYPGGRYSDSWGRAILLIPSLGILVVGIVLTSAATGYLVLLVGVGVFGLGRGLYASPARALISDLFVDNRGRALGVFTAGSDVGGIIASGATIVVIAVATWRGLFVPLALVLAVLGVLFVLVNDEPYRISSTSLDVAATGRRILSSSRQRRAIVAFFLFYFMINGVLNFLPEYLRQVKGFSPELAGVGFAFLFVSGIVAKPTSGAISDRFPRELVSSAAMLLSMVALVLLLVADSVLGIVASIVAFSLCYKSQFPIIDAILLDAAPDDNMGGDIGAARSIYLTGGSLGPTFVGYVAGRFDFTVAFGVLVALLGVATLLIVDQHRL